MPATYFNFCSKTIAKLVLKIKQNQVGNRISIARHARNMHLLCVSFLVCVGREGGVGSFDRTPTLDKGVDGGSVLVSMLQQFLPISLILCFAGSVVAWDMRNPCTGVWQQRGALQGPIVGVQFLTNRSQVVVASGEGTVHLLDVRFLKVS